MDNEISCEIGTSIRFEDSVEDDNVLDNLSKCLFCRNECERDYGVEYLQGHAHKIITRENKTEQNFHGVPNGLIGHHLQSIFVLERMLSYPKGRCYQYLQRYSTLHPGLWFSICSTCRETVDKCYQSWCEIMKHQKEMDQLKSNVIELIVSTNSYYLENEDSNQSIVNEIRNFVVLKALGKDSHPEVPAEDVVVCTPALPQISPHLSPLSPIPQHVPDSNDDDYEVLVDVDKEKDSDSDSDASFRAWNNLTGGKTLETKFSNAPKPATRKRKKRTGHRCRTCHFSSKLLDVYKEHLESPRHKNALENRILTCQYCGKSFCRSDNLLNHQRLMHYKELNIPPIKCELCGQCFYSKTLFNAHMREHTSTYCCEHCGKQLLSKVKLERHVRVVHSESRPFGPDEKHFTFVDGVYTCEFCPKEYRSNTHIRGHLKKLHRDLLRFRCPGCDQVEVSAGGLVHHMTKCTKLNEGRAFKCESCEESFFHASHLKKHRRALHPETFNETKHTCELCGKSYYALNRLITHQKVCTVSPKIDDDDDK